MQCWFDKKTKNSKHKRVSQNAIFWIPIEFILSITRCVVDLICLRAWWEREKCTVYNLLVGCVFYGVVMFATGCTDIAHLMVIALDRLMAVTSPIRYMAWGKKTSISAAAIVFCWIFGSIWAILPLTGVEHNYTVDLSF